MVLGVQLYNLMKNTELNVEERLKVISTIGYPCVELCGFNGKDYDGYSPVQLRQILTEQKLSVCGAHVRYSMFETDMECIISYHKELGVRRIAIPRPVIETKEDITALIAGIKKYAKRFSEEGMELYYHCHDFEFQEFDGIRPIDCILNETDVMLELDVYWAEKGGVSVIEYMKQHRNRILYLHIKDGDEHGSCAVGEGSLPCSQYWKAAEELGTECIIVEDDLQLPDGITSICNSMQAIRKIRMDD